MKGGVKIDRLVIYTMIEVVFIALIYWIYSASVIAITGGGRLTIHTLLSSLKTLLFQKKVEEAIKTSVIWLDEMPSSAFYTETLLIAATVFSALQYLTNLLSRNQNSPKNSYEYIAMGITLTVLTQYLFIIFSSTRRYFYGGFLLSPFILSNLFKQQEKRTEIMLKNKNMISAVLLSMGILIAMNSFSAIWIADKYMPLPSHIEWLIAMKIYYLLDNSTWFYISPLGEPNIYTDIRLAVPLTYYGLNDLFNILERSSLLTGIRFDIQGKYFIDRYFSDNYKTKLANNMYNLLAIWDEYYIILFN